MYGGLLSGKLHLPICLACAPALAPVPSAVNTAPAAVPRVRRGRHFKVTRSYSHPLRAAAQTRSPSVPRGCPAPLATCCAASRLGAGAWRQHADLALACPPPLCCELPASACAFGRGGFPRSSWLRTCDCVTVALVAPFAPGTLDLCAALCCQLAAPALLRCPFPSPPKTACACAHPGHPPGTGSERLASSPGWLAHTQAVAHPLLWSGRGQRVAWRRAAERERHTARIHSPSASP